MQELDRIYDKLARCRAKLEEAEAAGDYDSCDYLEEEINRLNLQLDEFQEAKSIISPKSTLQELVEMLDYAKSCGTITEEDKNAIIESFEERE